MNSSLQNILIISFVLALTFLYAVYQKQKIMGLYDQENNVLMVQMLPSFELESFSSGEKITFESIHTDNHELLVVHFWGTWCPPCIPEFPKLLEFARKLAKDSRIKFLAIAVRDQLADVKKFMKRFKNLPPNFHLALDKKGEAMNSFGTVKVPETHYYFKKRSAKRFIGPQKWENTFFLQELQKLL